MAKPFINVAIVATGYAADPEVYQQVAEEYRSALEGARGRYAFAPKVFAGDAMDPVTQALAFALRNRKDEEPSGRRLVFLSRRHHGEQLSRLAVIHGDVRIIVLVGDVRDEDEITSARGPWHDGRVHLVEKRDLTPQAFVQMMQ